MVISDDTILDFYLQGRNDLLPCSIMVRTSKQQSSIPVMYWAFKVWRVLASGINMVIVNVRQGSQERLRCEEY